MSINSPEKIHPKRCPLGANSNFPPRHWQRYQRSWQQRWRHWYGRLVRLQGKPEAIARGLACGVFSRLFPIFGLQAIAGVFLAILLQGSKILTIAETWISTSLTHVSIYAFNFDVSKSLLNQHDELTNINLQAWEQVKECGLEIFVTLFVGCFIVGLVFSILNSFLGVRLIRRVCTSY